MAAGTNEGGHYFVIFPHLVLLTRIAFTSEGIVVGFKIFA